MERIVDSRVVVDALGLQDDTHWVKKRPRTFCAAVFKLNSDRLNMSWSGSLWFFIIRYLIVTGCGDVRMRSATGPRTLWDQSRMSDTGEWWGA